MIRARNAFFAGLFAAMVASAAVDPGLLNLVMPDARIVSGMQVEASKASPFGRYVLSQMHTDDTDFSKFVADTGFDPRRDLSEIVVATGGTSDKPAMLLLGRGVFNPGKIFSVATANGATLTNYGGIDIVTHGNDGSTLNAFAFLAGNTAIMGSLDAVHGAIDRFKASAVAPQSIVDQVQAISGSNDAWFLSTGPLTDFFNGKIADANLNGAMQGNLLQAVLQASGGVKFAADSVLISGQAVTRSPKDAGALADVVRFLAGLVQLNKDNDPQAQQVASLLDTMKLSTQDSTMLLSLTVPEPVIEKLFVPGVHRPPKVHAHKTAALR